MQPPRIGGTRTRKAWEQTRPMPVKRVRGRAGQKARAQVIAEEPLCRICLAQGRTRMTEIVDHIKPLAWGGSNERSNKQGLCVPCHDEKSKAERAIDAEQRRRFDLTR
ncbi:HNH endonuclease signature motif containing protein [uncultured Sphingomonas sp.]|uniref:HNH endonuclease n=1 Tax=uncultured Sphingomonas sp. TaxID=158754 RepID=UPI0025D100FB|nr:HNH endonuclease signature motif containing protein [uncultured Sphingomonas sp.]